MYAVIESGGKQYRVELGTEIQVDRLHVQPGESITLDRVLLVADEERAAIGRPFVDGAVVNADVVDQARGEKIVVFKYKPKARRRVKKGFRASLTTLRISDIAYDGASAAKDAARDERRRKQDEAAAEQAAAERATADQALAAKLATQEEAAEEAPPARRARASQTAKVADAVAEVREGGAASAEAEQAPTGDAATKAASDAATAEATADAGPEEPAEAEAARVETAESATESATTVEPEAGAGTDTTTSDKDG